MVAMNAVITSEDKWWRYDSFISCNRSFNLCNCSFILRSRLYKFNDNNYRHHEVVQRRQFPSSLRQPLISSKLNELRGRLLLTIADMILISFTSLS